MALRVVHYPIHIADPAKRPEKPFSAVLLADLHNAELGRHNAELIRRINEAAPSFIISAGDLVTAKAGRCGTDRAAALVKELSAFYPVYLVRGNHEERLSDESSYPGRYSAYLSAVIGDRRKKQIQANIPGTVLIDNSSVKFTVNGMPIVLTGYVVPLDKYHRAHRRAVLPEEITEAVGKPDRDAYQILAAHHPDGFPAYAAWGADLTLSGHVHGGIVRLPVFGGVVGASFIPFPPYTRGVYELNGRKMVLSAGLGSHTIKLRVNNPPELVCLDFCTD